MQGGESGAGFAGGEVPHISPRARGRAWPGAGGYPSRGGHPRAVQGSGGGVRRGGWGLPQAGGFFFGGASLTAIFWQPSLPPPPTSLVLPGWGLFISHLFSNPPRVPPFLPSSPPPLPINLSFPFTFLLPFPRSVFVIPPRRHSYPQVLASWSASWLVGGRLAGYCIPCAGRAGRAQAGHREGGCRVGECRVGAG